MSVYPPQEHIVELAVHIFDGGLILLVKLNEESAVVQRYRECDRKSPVASSHMCPTGD